ncbi:unnamed protein product [Owenia fusiformis]|uniref:Uncharacterized protein n=1 Tax=Owenia fusiformis TaxID=6347 RepID=A0A8J1TZW4_OWEFU|nr:unnamed protein product [Owenia fusiformis]
MSDCIPFDSHLYSNVWEPLAELLNPESGKNWRALAHELKYTVLQIKNLETLQRCGGSNTLKLFEDYVRRGDQHSLEEVLEALTRIGRKDCIRIIESQIESIRQEYRERSQLEQQRTFTTQHSGGSVEQIRVSPLDSNPGVNDSKGYSQLNQQGPLSPSKQSPVQDNTVSSGIGEQVNNITDINSSRGLQNMTHSPNLGINNNNNGCHGNQNMTDASNIGANGPSTPKVAIEHSEGSRRIPYSSQLSVTMTTQDAVIKLVVENKDKSNNTEEGHPGHLNDIAHQVSPINAQQSPHNNEPVQNSYSSMMELLNNENNTGDNSIPFYNQGDTQMKQYIESNENEVPTTTAIFTPYTKPLRYNSTSGGSVTVVKSSPSYPDSPRGGIPVPILSDLPIDLRRADHDIKLEGKPPCAHSVKHEAATRDQQLGYIETKYQSNSLEGNVVTTSPKLNPLPPMSSFLVQSHDMSNVGAEVEVTPHNDLSPTKLEEAMDIDPPSELVSSPVFPNTEAHSNTNSLDLESMYSNFSPSSIKIENFGSTLERNLSGMSSTSSTKGYNGTLWQLNHATDPQNINQGLHGDPNVDHTKYAMKQQSSRQPYHKQAQAYKYGMSSQHNQGIDLVGVPYQQNGHDQYQATRQAPVHTNQATKHNQVKSRTSENPKPLQYANTFPKYTSHPLVESSKISPAESTPGNVGTGTLRRVSRGARILVTYSCDNPEHEKNVLQLCKCLRDNDFACSAEMLERFVERNDLKDWLDTRFTKAHIIIVCISPKYAADVKNRQNNNNAQNPTRYLYQKMLREYQQHQNNNLRFVPLLFPGGDMKHVPCWMATPPITDNSSRAKKSLVHRWPHGYRDLFFHVEQRYSNLYKDREHNRNVTH